MSTRGMHLARIATTAAAAGDTYLTSEVLPIVATAAVAVIALTIAYDCTKEDSTAEKGKRLEP